MGSAKTLRKPNADSTVRPDVGDWVWVLFWRSHVLPDNTDAGNWQTIETRVVSSGKMVVCDLAGTARPDGSSNPSGLYFAEQNDVFPDRDAAMAAAHTRKPPVPAALARP